MSSGAEVSPADPESRGPESRGREWAKLMNLSVIGMVFPVSLVLGYLGGRFIGGWFEAARLGGLIGAVFGVVGGFYNLFKMVDQATSRASRGDSNDRAE